MSITDETGLFPGDMLPDMFESSTNAGDAIWLTCEAQGFAIGFCYVEPEKLAEGAWNMLAIAVSPANQTTGAGKALSQHLETTLKKNGARILLADTSGTAEFSGTRAFYKSIGYVEEARIRDFWADGDDKVTFIKALR